MGRRAKPELTRAEKIAVAQKAQAAESMKALQTVADKNLQLAAKKRQQELTSEQCEAIIFRIIGGSMLGEACSHLGIDPAVVRNYAYINVTFSDKLARAYAHGQHALVEELKRIPYDDTLSDASKRLLSENLKWIASRVNRPVYGDRVDITATLEHKAFVFPTLPKPPVIDAEIDDSE